MRNRKMFLGSVMAGAVGIALLCGGGAAQAQLYNEYGSSERVIVGPVPFDTIQVRTEVGHFDGGVNPSILSISHPVNYADLDLNRQSDFDTLRTRVNDTARDLCDRLDAKLASWPDEDANRECVNKAIRDAMNQVPQAPIG